MTASNGATQVGNEVTDLIAALHAGEITLDEVAERFRQYSWPRRATTPKTSYADLAAAEQEDPDPYIPGSYDDVVGAYDRGMLTDTQYSVLTEAIAESRSGNEMH